MEDILKNLNQFNAPIIIILFYIIKQINKVSVDFQTTKDRSYNNQRQIEKMEEKIDHLEAKDEKQEKAIMELKEMVKTLKKSIDNR